ncbi:MAG TPA: selenocysteine-specific translation elongation factor [Thermoanaerobaculia bacterium]|nr:selenocysteine-specific translation elongation factor [Thermoanaerobaculia bacterium]
MTTSDEKKRRVVGTAGHIDHGKTALVRALTGIDCDRLPEEKRRGITIDLGFASMRAEEAQIAFIDVPGHERFVKNMLAGVGGIDAALLVVAADESIKPQTREHFAICSLLRIPTGLVAITKSDLVDSEIVEIVRMEIEEMVRGSFLEGRPIIPVSSTTGVGIEELKGALIETVMTAPDREGGRSVFRLPIDRVFTMKGFGSVVTGTTVSGELTVDQEVEILPRGIRSRARNIQTHGIPQTRAVAGERTSINLTDVATDALRRGDQIVRPGTLGSSRIVTVRLELLPDAAPLEDDTRVRFHHFSSELLGKIRLLDSDAKVLRGGGHQYAQIRLESPVVAIAGDRFVIRRYSPAITIGGGTIIDPHPLKLSKRTRHEILETLEKGTLPERLRLKGRLAGLFGVTLVSLQKESGIRLEVLRDELAPHALPDLVLASDGANPRWLHRSVLTDLETDAMRFLESFFKENRVAVGVPKGELVQKLFPGKLDAAIIEFLLAYLQERRIITLAGDLVDVPGRSPELKGVEGELGRLIEARYRAAGLTPPAVSELIRTIPQKPKVVEGVIGFLVKTGRLVRLADGVYLHTDVVSEAKSRLMEHRGKSAEVGWFKELYGITRKLIIPLLELFDREGLTRRVGDQRVIL